MIERKDIFANAGLEDTSGSVAGNDRVSSTATSCIDRLGPQFIQGIYSAGRTLRIHDIKNRAAQTALSRLMQILNELLSFEGRVTVRISTDLLYINDVRLLVDPQSAAPVLSLLEDMKTKRVEELDFGPELSVPEMGAFLNVFSTPPGEDDVFGELSRLLSEAGVTNVRLTECIEREKYLRDAKVERREIKEESNRAMSRAILFMGEVMRAIEHQRPIQLPKAHRIAQQLADILRTDESIIVGLASIKDYDEYTFSHSVNVSVLSMLIADRMGLSKNDAAQIGVAALFHDVGKTHVPQLILNKPGTLTADEWKLMERHTMLGVIELARVRSLRAMLDPIFVSLQHHLSYTGRGYPEKPGEWQIHPFVHIVAVADVYDAMTTPRVYREGTLTPDQALLFILRNAGTTFDPHVAKVFIRTMGVYPVGTVVQLDTGEAAIVLKQNENTRLIHRPIVTLLDAGGPQGKPLDLSERAPGGLAHARTIVRSLRNHGLEVQKAGCFISK